MNLPTMKKWMVGIMCTMMLMTAVPPQIAWADTTDRDLGAVAGFTVDPNQNSSITIEEDHGKKVDITFSLYQIATLSEDGHAYYTDDFYAHIGELGSVTPANAETASQKDQLAKSYLSMIEQHAIGAVATAAATNSNNGRAVFSNLKPGYYLAYANAFTTEDGRISYQASPMLLVLPEESGAYQMSSAAKSELVEQPAPPDNPPDNPPNNPPGTPPTTPPRRTTPPPTTATPTPSRPTTPLGDIPTPLSKLPQTGVLWWPVPVLFLCGLGLYISGHVIEVKNDRRRKKS